MSMKLAVIALAAIVPPKVALRTVDKENPKYKGLVASIAHSGVTNPIAVKLVEVKDELTGLVTEKYQVIDGLHRYMGSIDAGKTEIPAQILDADEAQALELQIEGNVHKIETRPIEYSRQLLKILAAHPDRTCKIQAERLGQSEGWLKDKLRLQRLLPEIQTLVDEGKIPLSSAYILAKMDEDEQPNWVDLAQELPPDQFLPQCSNRINELKKLAKNEPKPEPTPTAVPRKRGEIMDMYSAVANSVPKNEAEKGFANAIKWAVQMDDASIEAWHKAQAERKAKSEAKKAENAAKRDAKKGDLPSIDDLLK